MAEIVLNIAWFAFGSLLVATILIILGLLAFLAMSFAQFVREWMDDMGWGN